MPRSDFADSSERVAAHWSNPWTNILVPSASKRLPRAMFTSAMLEPCFAYTSGSPRDRREDARWLQAQNHKHPRMLFSYTTTTNNNNNNNNINNNNNHHHHHHHRDTFVNWLNRPNIFRRNQNVVPGSAPSWPWPSYVLLDVQCSTNYVLLKYVSSCNYVNGSK